MDSHGQYNITQKKNIVLSGIIFKYEIINPLIRFHFLEKEKQHA